MHTIFTLHDSFFPKSKFPRKSPCLENFTPQKSPPKIKFSWLYHFLKLISFLYMFSTEKKTYDPTTLCYLPWIFNPKVCFANISKYAYHLHLCRTPKASPSVFPPTQLPGHQYFSKCTTGSTADPYFNWGHAHCQENAVFFPFQWLICIELQECEAVSWRRIYLSSWILNGKQLRGGGGRGRGASMLHKNGPLLFDDSLIDWNLRLPCGGLFLS